jgi:hypothetical protein
MTEIKLALQSVPKLDLDLDGDESRPRMLGNGVCKDAEDGRR